MILEGPLDASEYLFQLPQLLRISADVNFNGTIEASEMQETMVTGPNQNVSFSFQFHDDGPSPGNTTPKDNVDIKIEFVGDVKTETITVNNVAPTITSLPYLDYGRDAQGKYIDVSIGKVDPETQDRHRLRVKFGEMAEVVGPWELNFRGCENRQVGVRVYYTTLATLYPMTIVVEDDDSGRDQRTYTAVDLAVNSDDDGPNNVQDLNDRPADANEDDLLPITGLTVAAMDPDSAKGTFYLNYDSSVILLWDSPEKTNLILPRSGVIVGGIDYTGQTTLWAEGVSPGSSKIYVTWHKTNWDEIWNCETDLIGNMVTARVSGIDVDIDSDNNRGVLPPDRDPWEEYLEDNPYGIGKMVFHDATEYTPVVVQLPPSLNPNDPTVRVLFETLQVGASSGEITIWDKPKGYSDKKVLATGLHTLQELHYEGSSVTVYLEATTLTYKNLTLADVNAWGKTDDRLKLTLLGAGAAISDTVKWMNVQADTFYPTLQWGPHSTSGSGRYIRNAGASEKIYDRADKKDFTMKYLSKPEVLKLIAKPILENPDSGGQGTIDYIIHALFHPEVGSLVPSAEPIPGFKAGIYRDHAGGPDDFVLAFAGTESHTLDDMLTNLVNLLRSGEPQYVTAMLVTTLLHNFVPRFSGIQTTGHSLGGGLASAAAIAAGITHADTFNSSGLPLATVMVRDIDGQLLFPGAEQRYTLAPQFIDAYNVSMIDARTGGTADAPDFLTFVQQTIVFLPDAVGLQHPTEGLYDLTYLEKTFLYLLRSVLQNLENGNLSESYLTYLLWLIHGYFASAGLSKLVASHSFPSIYYGLLHEDNPPWNMYDGVIHTP